MANVRGRVHVRSIQIVPMVVCVFKGRVEHLIVMSKNAQVPDGSVLRLHVERIHVTRRNVKRAKSVALQMGCV